MVRVKLDFRNMNASNMAALAGIVQVAIKKNADVFSYTDPLKPPPPRTDVVLGAIILAVLNAYSDYKKGGSNQKVILDKAVAILLGVLNEYAIYVDTIANGDEGIIVLSGFNVAYGIHPVGKQTAPGTPVISAKRAETSGEIDVVTSVFAYAFYGCIISEDKPLDAATTINAAGQLIIPVGHTNRIIHQVDIHRIKKIVGLTKGKTYWIYYYVSNSAGTSQLSTGFEILCG